MAIRYLNEFPDVREGDRVSVENTECGEVDKDFCGSMSKSYEDRSGVVTKIQGSHVWVRFDGDSSASGCFFIGNFTVLNRVTVNKSKNMSSSLLQKAALAFKKEPEKSFIKAGVMDSNGDVTSDGVNLVVAHLLRDSEFAGEFKTAVVDPILEIIAEENK